MTDPPGPHCPPPSCPAPRGPYFSPRSPVLPACVPRAPQRVPLGAEHQIKAALTLVAPWLVRRPFLPLSIL